ncbi:MAG: hypothetical protein ACM3SU_02845, partial [Acidobacteriota bacterium]
MASRVTGPPGRHGVTEQPAMAPLAHRDCTAKAVRRFIGSSFGILELEKFQTDGACQPAGRISGVTAGGF